MGLFDNSGEILGIAGPVGALISYIIVGIGVICIMEGIAEMIGHWPIANAMVEFVKAFVDKDLAIVVGLAYCTCWTAVYLLFAIVSGVVILETGSGEVLFVLSKRSIY
jgi:amino acid transporter